MKERKKSNRKTDRGEEREKIIQKRLESCLGRVGTYRGPSWLFNWAELVLGQVSIGPSWFWAELTRHHLKHVFET